MIECNPPCPFRCTMLWARSSMEEQWPFKPLVLGSSPSALTYKQDDFIICSKKVACARSTKPGAGNGPWSPGQGRKDSTRQMTLSRFITISEAAERLHTSEKDVQSLVQSGKLDGGILPDGETMVVNKDSLPTRKEELPE